MSDPHTGESMFVIFAIFVIICALIIMSAYTTWW